MEFLRCRHVEASLAAIREIVKHFSAGIKSQGGTLREQFVQLRKICTQLNSGGGPCAGQARDLSSQLQGICQ